jgi:hypothetical protein
VELIDPVALRLGERGDIDAGEAFDGGDEIGLV